MGGAVFNHHGTLTATNSTFVANTAAGGAGFRAGAGLGGAIFNLNGSVTAEFTTTARNTAAQGGGGIYNLAYDSAVGRIAAVTLSRSIVSDSTGPVPDPEECDPEFEDCGAPEVSDVVSGRPDDTGAGANHPSTSATETFTGPNLVERVEGTPNSPPDGRSQPRPLPGCQRGAEPAADPGPALPQPGRRRRRGGLLPQRRPAGLRPLRGERL